MITALLVIAFVAGGLFLACAWADSQPPTDPEPYQQPTHVHVLNDQEPNA